MKTERVHGNAAPGRRGRGRAWGGEAPGRKGRRRAWGGRRAVAVVAVAALALLAAFPDVAHACPVCFDRDDEARIAFLATTGLLTLLPLGLVAGAGMWLRRRAREVAEKEEGREGSGARRDESVDPHDGS